ncbi:MAG: hypothetical protein CMI54_00185, partial [Parcubacteria group bacterium]|nr:hypothetical protein [Parcubacteria group bacterium]
MAWSLWNNDPRSAIESIFYNTDEYDSYKQDNEYYAIVISNGSPVNDYLASLIEGNLGTKDFIITAQEAAGEDWAPIPPEEMAMDYFTTSKRFNNKYLFHARLLGKNSPHDTIPWPCFKYVIENAGLWIPLDLDDPFAFDDFYKEYNQQLVDLHTKFITSECAGSRVPRIGDIYRVRLKPSRTENTTYRLDYGLALGFHSDIGKSHKAWQSEGEEVLFKPYQEGCEKLLDLFDGETTETTLTAPGDVFECTLPPDRFLPKTWPPTDEERNRAIDTFLELLKPHLPSDTRKGSAGRTVQRGRNMIYNFAVKYKIPHNRDLNDAAEVERVRKILTGKSSGGPSPALAIAPPENSNHCVGGGCRGQSTEVYKVAFDLSRPGRNTRPREEHWKLIQEISEGLRNFKTDTGPTGYQTLLEEGCLPGPFIETGFVKGRSYNEGGGWNEEKGNLAVHVEFDFLQP